MSENITLAPVTSFTNDSSAVATVNANYQIITQAFTDVLDRYGSSPNSMQAVLDMNNFNIVNLPSPATINSPVRLVDVINPSVALTVPPVGTSGSTVPLLNGINTWSATQTFSSPVVLNGTVSGTGITTLFASPPSIGGTVPASGAFTTLSATGQITSTVSIGTAPLVITSTTNVANLNAATVNGFTFAVPGTIGSTTPGPANFTTLNVSSTTSFATLNSIGNIVASTGSLGSMNGAAIGSGTVPTLVTFYSTTANLGIYSGTGIPSFSSAQGSLYIRVDGAAATALYLNTSVTSGTTWTAVT